MIFEQVHFPTADCISIQSISHNVGKAQLNFNVTSTHWEYRVVLLLAVKGCRSLDVSLSGHSSGLQHQLMAERVRGSCQSVS